MIVKSVLAVAAVLVRRDLSKDVELLVLKLVDHAGGLHDPPVALARSVPAFLGAEVMTVTRSWALPMNSTPSSASKPSRN
jgi:hypothetical protein